MVTLLQLRSEPWWDREVITSELDWLGDELCARTGRSRAAAGTKGDYAHLNGGHRSQEWIANSRWCTDRSYTVQGGLTADQKRHVAAFDFTPGSPDAMIAQCKRLMAAMRAGRLDEVVELYGNVDGDQWVDGWDNLRDRAVTSDSSHLWHWHITIDRRHVANRALMERIAAIALGEDTAVSDEDVIKGLLVLFDEAANRSTPRGRAFSDDFRVAVSGSTFTKPVWSTLMGYDGAVETPANWGSENTHLALATAVTELLARAVAGAGAPKAIADLTELVKAGGGNAEVAPLAAKLDQLAAAVSTAAGAVAALQATVAALAAQIEARDAALAEAYAQDATER